MGTEQKMEDSPTLEEERLSYCLELHDQPRTIANRSQLDRALLEPRSISAQLEAVEALSLQVQNVLSKKLNHVAGGPDIEDEDGFEFTAELAGLSPSRSLSPVLSEPITTVPTLENILDLKESNAKHRAPLKQTRSLDTWKKFSMPIESSTRRGSCGPSMADKYRLSFVDISDSSTSSDDEYTKKSDKVHPILDPSTMDQGAPACGSKPVDTSRKSDRPTREWSKIDTHPNPIAGQKTARQSADLQHEEIGGQHNKQNPPATFILNQNVNYQTHNERYSRTSEHSGLEYDDEDLNYMVPTSNSATTKSSTSKKRPTNSISNENKEKTRVNTIVQNKTKSVDHMSFSPLYTMSISQLQNIVQLLETKLQGIIILRLLCMVFSI